MIFVLMGVCGCGKDKYIWDIPGSENQEEFSSAVIKTNVYLDNGWKSLVRKGNTRTTELLSYLNCCFRDADEFHSEENKTKMSQGIPLSDEDRLPWLKAIHEFIKRLCMKDENAVIACSALRKVYRTILLTGEVTLNITSHITMDCVQFVYLRGDYAVLEGRLTGRRGHFMPAVLLQSQLETLEEPEEEEHSMTVSIDQTVHSIVDYILSNCRC